MNSPYSHFQRLGHDVRHRPEEYELTRAMRLARKCRKDRKRCRRFDNHLEHISLICKVRFVHCDREAFFVLLMWSVSHINHGLSLSASTFSHFSWPFIADRSLRTTLCCELLPWTTGVNGGLLWLLRTLPRFRKLVEKSRLRIRPKSLLILDRLDWKGRREMKWWNVVAQIDTNGIQRVSQCTLVSRRRRMFCKGGRQSPFRRSKYERDVDKYSCSKQWWRDRWQENQAARM